jgi:hypothetical protein
LIIMKEMSIIKTITESLVLLMEPCTIIFLHG